MKNTLTQIGLVALLAYLLVGPVRNAAAQTNETTLEVIEIDQAAMACGKPTGAVSNNMPKIWKTIDLTEREEVIPQKESVITLTVAGQKTNIPVELFAFLHHSGGIPESNIWDSVECEFQVRAKEDGGFIWSCWASGKSSEANNFRVLTTESGKSYACYVRHGLELFHLTQSRESIAMRILYMERRGEDVRHPDALPVLRLDTLGDALGMGNIVGGARSWNVIVDKLSNSAGELRVTVHGNKPQPQCTFALRKVKWELVSCSGK